MSSASTQVFDCTELFELILLHDLSAAEVTRARQVSSRFRAVIDSSKALRRVMFLEPIKEQDYETYEVDVDEPWLINRRKSEPSHTVSVFHPVVQGRVFPAGRDPIKKLNSPLAPASWTSWSSGQWESMLITQPPATKYVLVCTSAHATYRTGIEFEGQTLGALRDAIAALDDNLEAKAVAGVGLWDETAERTHLSRWEAIIHTDIEQFESKIYRTYDDTVISVYERLQEKLMALGEDETTASIAAWHSVKSRVKRY